MTWHNGERLDKLDVLIGLAIKDFVDEDVERCMNADVSDITFSDNYYRRKRQVINRYIMKQRIAGVRKVASKVAIVMLCILSAAFITVMSVSALRNAIWDAIVEWYDDYIAIHYEESSSNTEEQSSGDNAIVVSPPTEILEYRKPQYVPDGVEEEIVLQSVVANIIDYYLGNELQFSYKQTVLDDEDNRFNNENSVVEQITINGNEASVVTSDGNDELMLVWADREYIYIISSYLKQDETVKIAESVG